MANVELLDKTLQYIEEHPEEHDQANWLSDCGTQCCFGGWAVKLSGHVVDRVLIGVVVDKHVSLQSIYGVARDELGLNDNQAHALFYSAQDLGDVRKVVELIKLGVDDEDAFVQALYDGDNE